VDLCIEFSATEYISDEACDNNKSLKIDYNAFIVKACIIFRKLYINDVTVNLHTFFEPLIKLQEEEYF
jgi:hypothetical protein